MSVIEFKNVSKVYDNRTIWGVHSMNFSVERGQIYTIMGPSGSGKTTTLNLIKGEITPDEGEVITDENFTISHLTSTTRLNEDKSVIENILAAIDREMTDSQAMTLARQSLSDLDLTNEIDKKPSELSSGQYQRALLACCLANSPDILLFDEPFGNIDQELKNEILDIILPVVREKDLTIIWVTHHLKEAFQYSNKMMILNFGKIQQVGTPQEIYFKPSNMFVANFIELKNIYVCTTAEGKSENFINITSAIWVGSLKSEQEFDHSKESLLIIRPEAVVLSEKSDKKAKLVAKRFSGAFNFCEFKIGEETILAHISSYIDLEVGKTYGININTQFISLINQI